jgi:hypothetical protein
MGIRDGPPAGYHEAGTLYLGFFIRFSEFQNLKSKNESPVKSPSAVMPDLIRHPEPLEFTGFQLSSE